MLDSRYVHLHEALGLGVMWLKQHAKLIERPSPPLSPSNTAQPKTSKTGDIHPSRLAVLKKINSTTLPTSPSPTFASETMQPETPSVSVEQYLRELSGSVPRAKVMAMSVCASPSDVLAGQLLSGKDGELFNKMLNAIGLSRDEVYLTAWLHEQIVFEPNPSSEAVQAAAPRVQAQWQLCGAKALLLMGGFFERDDVKMSLPAGQHFFIPHPQRILSDTTLKRPTWETLQALQQIL